MPAQWSPKGVLVRVQSIRNTPDDGIEQGYAEYVVTLEDGGPNGEEQLVELRLGDRRDTIFMISLLEIEGALRLLKRRRSAS